MVGFLAARTDLPVIGVGGVMTADDGRAMLDAGARPAAGLHRLHLRRAGAGHRAQRRLATATPDEDHADEHDDRLRRAAARALVAERGAAVRGHRPAPAPADAWGLPVDAGGLERCARTMVEALGDLVPVFKPQSAFFEAHGSPGIAVLERTLADIAAAGALSLLDVKRGDIGSTMDAYAAAYLTDGSPLAADAITVSPYLGFGSLAGAIDLARAAGPRRLRAGPDQQPRGPAGPARPRPTAGAAGRRGRSSTRRPRANAGRGVRARRPGGRRHHRADRGGLRPAATARSWRRASAPRAARRADLATVFGAALPWCCRRPSRELMAAGPDPAQIRVRPSRCWPR